MMTDREAIEYLKGVGYQASAFSMFEPYYEEGTNYKEAVDALETYVKDREKRAINWISVKKRMPDIDETVLCYSNKNGGDYFIGYIGYRSGAWIEDGVMHIGDVTHWMPLPKPPKEEA